MSVTKRSVSLDDQVAERVEHAAREDGVSFSTWLSVAAERQLLLREGLRGVAEWEADAGALIAAERSDCLLWSLHRATLTRGLTPTVPTGVLGEAWRGGPQPQLSRLLKGCLVEPLTEAQARAIGVLAARSGRADTVDLAVAHGVAATQRRRRDLQPDPH